MSLFVSSCPLPKRNASSLPFRSRDPVIDTIHVLLLRPPLLRPTTVIGCSFASKFHSYRTVDYEKTPRGQWVDLYLRVSTMKDPINDAAVVIKQWEAEKQTKLAKSEAIRVAKLLRKFGRFKLALDVCEWMVAEEGRFPFNSSDAAILLDLIAKVRGISSAEKYFMSLSEAFRDKRTYTALLNGYAHAKATGKAEAVLETLRNKGYLIEALPYNVIMTMYKDLQEHEKVISIIKEMRKKSVRLISSTFNIWISACAGIGDVEGMEQISKIVDTDENVNAKWSIFANLATAYIKLGNVEKAEKYVKEADYWTTGRDRAAFHHLLSLYSLLGKKEEVYKTWQSYVSSFRKMPNSGILSVLSALIKLDDIEGAELIYGDWLSTTPRYDPRLCSILLSYYIKHGQVDKAEHCLEDFRKRGGMPDGSTLEILAEAYIAEKQISKALSFLKAAATTTKKMNFGRWKPRPANVANFRALCEEQNDRRSMESLVEVLREVECLGNVEYASLIRGCAEEWK